MNKEEIDQKVRDYYESQQLSTGAVEQIIESTRIVRPPFWKRSGLLALAALTVLLLGVTTLWLQQPSFSQEVAYGVVKNHLKGVEPEIVSADLTRIGDSLPRLGFGLDRVPPALLEGMEIRGGRYCSVRDELAAQVTLADEQGKRCSLYVAPSADSLRKVKTGEYLVGDSRVTINRTGDRLFVLVR